MTLVRVITFIVENFLARFKFSAYTDAGVAVFDGWRSDQSKFLINDKDSKEITGAALNEVDEEVLRLRWSGAPCWRPTLNAHSLLPLSHPA